MISDLSLSKTVALTVDADGNGAITVGDSGPGIPEELREKIFEPFFTTKPVGEGTGLGLWISYGIAREHGGALSAANRSGGGAAFTLTLPAA